MVQRHTVSLQLGSLEDLGLAMILVENHQEIVNNLEREHYLFCAGFQNWDQPPKRNLI